MRLASQVFAVLALSATAVTNLFASSGCSATTGRECSVGADCASGACSADGVCLPEPKVDAAADVAADTANDTGGDDVADTGGSDTPPVGCAPNKDGKITADEVPLGPGLKATFRVATDAKVSTAGTPLPDGRRKWDLSVAFAGEKDVLVQTKALAGEWFAGKFPSASYTTGLSAESDLLGVFRVDAGSVSLLGVASPKDGLTRTELTYATPIPVLQFPVEATSKWKTTSNVTGTASGVTSFYTETYDSQVDAKGELVAPFGTFEVLRVRTVLTRQVGAVITTTRTFAFVAECFGTVATITSNANETQVEFGTASELRRLAP
jgi:hypothetical protein